MAKVFCTTARQECSIARRLTGSLMITVGLVSLITVGAIYWREVAKNTRELEEKADDIIAYQIGVLAKPLYDLDHHATRIVGATIAHNELVAELTIKDYFGRVAFAYTNPHHAGSVTRTAPVLHDDETVGEVFVSLTADFREHRNRSLLNSFAITILPILFTLIVVSGLLVRTFLRRPLDRLNAMVGAYAEGRYEAIEAHQPYVEFRPFSQVLQTMGRQILGQLRDLATAEEKYRSIFENAIEGIFQSTPEGRYFSVNPAMADLLGYASPAEVLATITDIARQTYLSSEDRERFNRLMEQDGRVIEFETELRRKDGTTLAVSISARAVRDEAGAILHYEGYLVDITRRKKAIEALHRTTAQLALLLESLPIVAFTARAGGDFAITYVSSGIAEMTGFPPECFIGEAGFWAGRIAREDASRIAGELPEVLATGRYRAEYRFRAADGSYRWFDDTRRLVRSPEGGEDHIAGTWRDITEEKRLRSEADYRLQQVIMADKLASLGQVAAGVAHEVSNPNSFIASNIPILEETWQIFIPILEEFAREHPEWRHRSLAASELCQDMEQTIRHIKIGSERINRIVSHLKEFVRSDEGLPPRPVQLNEVVESALTIVGAQARRSAAAIDLRLDPEVPKILGSFQKLEQVFTNLVVNALHAIPERGSGKLTIRTGDLPAHGAVMLQVEDNGSGMEREIMERIFEPFFTLRRDCGGTGLGLSVSYTLVREHHGVIGVLSRPGLGSRFTVFLPVSGEVRLDLRPAILCLHRDPGFTSDLVSLFCEAGDTLLYAVAEAAACLDFLDLHPEVDILLLDWQSLAPAEEIFLAELADRFPLLTRIVYDAPHASTWGDYRLEAPLQVTRLQQILYNIPRQKL